MDTNMTNEKNLTMEQIKDAMLKLRLQAKEARLEIKEQKKGVQFQKDMVKLTKLFDTAAFRQVCSELLLDPAMFTSQFPYVETEEDKAV